MECFIQCLLEFVNLIIENQHKKKFLHISVKLNKVKRDYFNVLKGYVKVLLIKKVIALGFCLANVMELCTNGDATAENHLIITGVWRYLRQLQLMLPYL